MKPTRHPHDSSAPRGAVRVGVAGVVAAGVASNRSAIVAGRVAALRTQPAAPH